MRRSALEFYRCPETSQPLRPLDATGDATEIRDASLESPGGRSYPVRTGIPDLTYPPTLPSSDLQTLGYYEREAGVYDKYLPLTFATFGVDEDQARNDMVDLLRLSPGSRVLELGCGTGRDTERIAARLGEEGQLFAQDLSPSMLHQAVDRLRGSKVQTEFSIGNACWLPFQDNCFDAVFHFGGLNTFGDIRRAFSEIARVTRPGGRVVIGDESMPLWLRSTEFGRVLMNSNPHYRFEIPFQDLPIEARNVRLQWIIGGVFYLFDFDVQEGEPTANLDFEIPGARGGTHRTRYYGLLEGVDLDAKSLAEEARRKSGRSMHDWLTDAVRRAANAELDDQQR